MFKKTVYLMVVVCACIGIAVEAYAHCQIPCGIYDDEVRVKLMYEDIQTVEKSINMINELSAKEKVDYNQLVRWIDNKEVHADKIKDLVMEYFLTQRIKPVGPDQPEAYQKYIRELSLLHQMAIWSMKSKQSVDIETVGKLRENLDVFSASYFGNQEHAFESAKKLSDKK